MKARVNSVVAFVFCFSALVSSQLRCRAEVPDAALDALLRRETFGRVIQKLKDGEVAPPRFALVKELDSETTATLPLFMTVVEGERTSVRSATMPARDFFQHLLDGYTYFQSHESYASLLLSDNFKRLLLECVQEAAVKGAPMSKLADMAGELEQTELGYRHLEVIWGPNLPIAAAQPNRNTATARLDAARMFWQSHTKSGNPSLTVQESMRESINTSVLLSAYHPRAMGRRIQESEFVRIVMLEGTLEFLRRGGDPSKVSFSDASAFVKIMPPRDARQFCFPALGISSFSADYLMMFMKTLRLPNGDEPTSWVTPVFR